MDKYALAEEAIRHDLSLEELQRLATLSLFQSLIRARAAGEITEDRCWRIIAILLESEAWDA